MLDEIETPTGFRFKVDRARVIDPDVDWLVQTLDKWVAAGERFKNRETIQIGFGSLKVRSNSDGTTSLLEPDFAAMPIEWVDTVTQTLIDLRTQKDVCESYFDVDEADFPSLQSGFVCSGLEEAPFLALPAGTLLQADDEGIDLYYRGEPVAPKRGSYMERLDAISRH